MSSFEEVSIEPKSLSPYRKFNSQTYHEIIALSHKLKGKRIFHINSTSLGGGVAELLKSRIPIEKWLGINSHWIVIHPLKQFFVITKKIHNFLQGGKNTLTEQEKKLYINESYKIAKELEGFLEKQKPDLLFIHDPQPLILGSKILTKIPRILRFHIDLFSPDIKTLEFFRPFIEKYSLLIISREDYRPQWFPSDKTATIMPAIDPFTEKNRVMSLEEAREILLHYEIHPDRPIISQISRFDKWKDPLGVIDAYYHAKNYIPDLQLILVGFIQATDDPEAKEIFKKVEKHSQGDPNIFLFANVERLRDIGNDTFVNAIQTASDVILQKSIREGFGLTVTEAMWKEKVVINGNAKGIRLQIQDGKNGFLAPNSKKAAEYIVQLLKNKVLQTKLGREAKKTVKEKFLLPRYIKENLEAYMRVLK